MNRKTIISTSNNKISKLEVLIKERESIRRKLAITAKKLAKTAKEKESVRRKLAVTVGELRLKAKQLAKTAREKEYIRRKLAMVAQKLSLKADELVTTNARKKAILASIGDAVMACNREGLIILFNRKAVAITGFPANEVIGKHYKTIQFVREIDNKPGKDFIAEAMKTGQKTVMADNTLLIRKDGSKIPVADSAEPIRYTHGALIGCVVVFRDISKEKEIDKAKSEFISVASHQLKTPATIVGLYTEMLLNGNGGVITPKQKEYIDEVHNANVRIVDIVNTLLNISRIEMGIFSMVATPADIIDFLRSAVIEVQATVKEKNIIVKEDYHQLEHIVPIDKLLFNLVFSNLLSNAIKYTPHGGVIAIKSLEVKKNQEIHDRIIKQDSLLISVSDNGCGIPTDSQDKVFNKFFRSDNARREHTDGSGMGLYIVKSMLDHIEGDVWFWSEEKVGTTFYFTIPVLSTKHVKNVNNK